MRIPTPQISPIRLIGVATGIALVLLESLCSLDLQRAACPFNGAIPAAMGDEEALVSKQTAPRPQLHTGLVMSRSRLRSHISGVGENDMTIAERVAKE